MNLNDLNDTIISREILETILKNQEANFTAGLESTYKNVVSFVY